MILCTTVNMMFVDMCRNDVCIVGLCVCIHVLTVTLLNKNPHPYTSMYLFSGNMTCTCHLFLFLFFTFTQTIHTWKGEILMKTMKTLLFRSRFSPDR